MVLCAKYLNLYHIVELCILLPLELQEYCAFNPEVMKYFDIDVNVVSLRS